ncbi:thiamine diphosphokinase [Alloscardovia criceti]|uniref:thiamine diphosphokinase n=1 Tax=Alloscardovia criceti TaxID=356828 RepID=UPI00035CF95D|nr:thiamine diphosphokinase [Alloscardovia criceti]
MPFIPADAYVIAADGGYDHIVTLGITPHAFIGDMDSITADVPIDSATHIIELPSEKDDSDMMAAVRFAWEKGIREFEFFGVFGGRMDHSLANIQTAAKIAASGGAAFMHGDHVITTVITDAIMTFPSGYVSSKRPISVFSYSDVSEHVSIHGLKYVVDDVRMTNTEPYGLSNEFLPDTPASIAVEGGSLVVVYPSEAPTPRIVTDSKPWHDFGKLSRAKSEKIADYHNDSPRRGRHAA